MVDEIRRAIPNPPKNVFVIGPDSPMNTYAAMQKCDAVIIYGTKVGVELSSLGIPVIVAGEAWIRNKGLTLDASSAREYFGILDRLPLGERMSPAAIQQARKYAYHYFFRRLIPLPFLQQGSSDALFTLEIGDLDDLRPGRYPGLDVICDGIMKGTEFIYPAEAHGGPVAASGKFTLTYAGKLAGRSSSKPLVSVIIPTATPEPGSLDAVYAQAGIGTQFDVEVIVVDNGSVGGGASIASPREGLQQVRLERPATAGAVRNVGLKAAKGAYVAFLDDGDLWFPERLRTQIAVLEHDVESAAVYGQFIATGDGRETLWPEAGAASAGWVFEAVLSDDFARSSFVTARREAVEQAGFFDEALDGLEMWDMFLRLSFLGRVSFVSGPAGRAHFAKDRTWLERIQKGQHQTELPYVVGKACALLPEASERLALRRRVMSRWFIEIARRLDKAETGGLLRAHVLSSLKHDPWLLSDRRSRRPVLAYAARGLARMLPASRRRLARALRLG
jgi:glycosyltransferase involved in cell wall biosynthesis